MKKSLYFLFVYSTPSSCGHSSYIPLRQHPAMLRDRAGGEGNALIRFLYCGYFLTPPSLADTSPIFCYAKHPVILRDTAGRRLIPYDVSCLSFSSLYFFVETPRNTTGHGREEVNTLRCIVFVFLLTIFLCGNTPQCYGTRQGGGLSSTLYSLL